MSNTFVNSLARAELVDMIPYQSARRLQAGNGAFNEKTWLNANEASGDGQYQLNGENINRYPDFQPDSLLNAYSQYTGLTKNQILATRGADEGIELLIRTFCTPYQDNILICPPTYGMYAISAKNHGAGIVKVPLIENTLDIDGIKAQVGKVNLVFLCSPGNPTGNLLPHTQLKAALDLFKDTAIVVVDEAYIEFSAEQSTVSWLAKYPNLVVLRTLSKAFASAGLRCGFTLASNDIITMLSKVIAPYPVPAPIAELASEILSESGIQVMKERVAEVNTLQAAISQWLAQQTWCEKVFASDANFVLFKTSRKDEIFNTLIEQGILIRDQSKQIQLEDCLRISIGSKDELEYLKNTLTAAIK